MLAGRRPDEPAQGRHWWIVGKRRVVEAVREGNFVEDFLGNRLQRLGLFLHVFLLARQDFQLGLLLLGNQCQILDDFLPSLR